MTALACKEVAPPECCPLVEKTVVVDSTPLSSAHDVVIRNLVFGRSYT